MRPQFSHDVVTSTVLWLDYRLTNTGQAYRNVTGALYRGNQTGIPGYVYASPYRAWVWDVGSPGANVPSGFYNSSGNFLTSNSGIGIDFLNGRVVTPTDWGPTLTGTYARKEFNVYPSTTEESMYLLDRLYNGNINIKYPLTGLYGNQYAAPLIMVTNARGVNEPWALGGMENTTNIVRCFIISNDNYLQEGANSLLQDAAHSYISLAPITAAPLTNVNMVATGTLKTPGWSYQNNIANVYPCGQGLYLKNVYALKLSETQNNNATFMLSIVDIDLEKPRFVR